MTFDALRELLEVPENDDQELLYQEVLTALDAIDQSDFEQLSEEVQIWFNSAVEAVTEGKDIPEFQGEESADDDASDDDSGVNLMEIEAKLCKSGETYFIDMELEDGTIEAIPVTCIKKSMKTVTVKDGDDNEFKLDLDATVYVDQETEPEPKKSAAKQLKKPSKVKEEPKLEPAVEPEVAKDKPEKKEKSSSKKSTPKATDEVLMHRSVSLTNMTKEQLIRCLKAIATTLEECEG